MTRKIHKNGLFGSITAMELWIGYVVLVATMNLVPLGEG